MKRPPLIRCRAFVMAFGLLSACATEPSARSADEANTDEPRGREPARDAGADADVEVDTPAAPPALGEAFCPPELTFHEAQTIQLPAQKGYLFAIKLGSMPTEGALVVSSRRLFLWRTGESHPVTYELPFEVDGWVHPPVIADFNADGFADVLVSPAEILQTGAFAVLLNDGAGGFKPAQVTDLLDGEGVGAAGDVMGGPEADVVVRGSVGGPRVLVGLQDGSFVQGAALLLEEPHRSLTVAQLDPSHPKQDIAIDMRLFLSRPNDVFEEVLLEGGGPVDLILPGDVDGDQIVDLVLWSRFGFGYHVRGAGQGRFYPAEALEKFGSAPEYSSSEWLRDLDGDGRSDFLFAKQDVRFTRVVDGKLRYQGRIGSSGPEGCDALSLSAPGQFVPADVNGDGRVDVVTATRSSSTGRLRLTAYTQPSP